VIAGLSYELIRFLGSHEGKVVYVISRPGMWLQRLTTSEPDEDMIEVAIASVNAVFDWRAFQGKPPAEPEVAPAEPEDILMDEDLEDVEVEEF